MIDQQVIEIALQFMGRAQLTGNEVPQFVHASNALHAERGRLEQEQQMMQGQGSTQPEPAPEPVRARNKRTPPTPT